MKIHCLYDALVSPEDLKPHPRNRNTHPQDQIKRFAEILQYQGWRYAIKVSKQSGFITTGHGRRLSAMLNKWDKVPVVYQDYESTDQEYADVQADNAIASWAELDLSGVNLDIPDLGPDFDINMLGLKDFVIEPADKYADKDADETPEARKTDIKNGDLFVLGTHRLLCGDSTSSSNWSILFKGETADFCFTSPPYSDQRDYRGDLVLSPRHLAQFLGAPCELFAVNLGIKREKNEIVPYWDEYISAAKSYRHPLISWNIWNRQGFGFSIGNATADFPIEHEWIFVFGKLLSRNKIVENKSSGRKDEYNGNRQRDGTVKLVEGREVHSKRMLGTVFHHAQEMERTIDHPAKFPVALPLAYIEACTPKNAVVFEPFLGSGSTLIACEKTQRRCFGMEIDPQYCQVIIDRWEKFSGLKAVRLD